MLTGQRLFKGETVSDTLAAVLTREPEWNRVPPRAAFLLRRCLEKDPKQRLRDVGDARFLLAEDAPQPVSASRTRWPWKIATAALAIVTAIALVFLWISTRHAAPPVLQLSVDLGENAALSPNRAATMTLSPDGSKIAFLIGQQLVKSQIAVRRLDQSKAMPLAGTDGAEAPFFSPDGKSIAFFADYKLKKVDTAGGAVVTLCDAPSPREGSWGEDESIVFAATNKGGLSRVPAGGGTPQAITTLLAGEDSHRYPQVLPGAQAVLFMNTVDGTGEGRIEALSLKTGTRKILVQTGGYGHYLPSGHLVYIHNGTLFAAPMDVGRLELTGPPAAVLEDVSFNPGTGVAGFAFSQSGIFAYAATSPDDLRRPVGVLEQNGKVELLPIPRARYMRPRVSPDGLRLAVASRDGRDTHISIYEWASRHFSRLVFNGDSAFPVWMPDGLHLLFSSISPAPGPGIYWMRADGAGAPQRLLEGPGLVPASISSSAAELVYEVRVGPKIGLWKLTLDWTDASHPKTGVPERFPDPPMESPAELSPDGRWIAYVGGQSGTPEAFVRPFSGPGGPWQISTGGSSAVWSRKARELLYEGKPDQHIMVTSYSTSGDSFSPDPPRPWNDTRVESFDLMPDGKRALVIPAAGQKETTHATFLLNFMDDLRRRSPAGK